MKNSIFYTTVRSLDLAETTAHGGLKNSPVVANELVKFLAKNTNVDAIDRLEAELATIRLENSKLKTLVHEYNQKAAEALKVSNAANNKADQQKNAVAALEKRVKKLE